MADPTSAQENPAPPERTVPLRSVISWAATVAFIIAVIVGAGFIHIVFGDTISVCAKDGWALQDTFVDLDDYAGKPLLAMIDKAKVLRAMFACGTLKRPAFLDEEKPNRRTERPSPGQSTDSTSALSAYKVNMTKLKMSTYATVAFPLWKAAHPGKSCPGSISELKEYLAGTELDDLWGRPVKMLCGANLPAEATGIAFLSRGEDGEEGTSDDVKSWDETKPAASPSPVADVKPAPPAPKPPPPPEVPIEVTARQLFADYDTNEVAADEKYKSKTLLVTGTISSIGKDVLGDPYVQFAIGRNVYGVQCMFDGSSGLSSLKKGQQLTARCKEPGKLGNVILRGCALVPPEPASEIPAPKSADITVDMAIDGPQPADVQKRLAEGAASIWNYCRAAVIEGDRFRDVWHTASVSIGRNPAATDSKSLTFFVKATFDDRRRSVHKGAVAIYEVDGKLTRIRPLDESARRLCGIKSLDWSKIEWK